MILWRLGFVASLARPGGNITGSSLMLPELVGKQLELLKEVVPKVSRVAVLGNPANPTYAPLLRHAQDAARASGVRLQPLEARDLSEIDRAFAAITTERAGAVIVLADTMLLDHRTRIADHAVRRRLPTMFGVSEHAEAGGLLAYGPSLADGYRRAATYVDKILKGAKPADLPSRAADEVRVGHQPQDRQGARPDDPAVAAAAGGSGDRVGDGPPRHRGPACLHGRATPSSLPPRSRP